MTDEEFAERFEALKLILPPIRFTHTGGKNLKENPDGWFNTNHLEKSKCWHQALSNLGFNTYIECRQNPIESRETVFFRRVHRPLYGRYTWWKPQTYPNNPIRMFNSHETDISSNT